MTTFRTDYQPFAYQISTVELWFDLEPASTQVLARLSIQRTGDPGQPLALQGHGLNLHEITVDDAPWEDHQLSEDGCLLTLNGLPDNCIVQTVSNCIPQANDSLMGLYLSGQSLFTQCEPEGFRRITWFADRPDVMSEYRVTLRANKAQFPALLSNGNLVAQRDLPGGRHEVQWHDPFPKPCYLFALVAGRFDCREQHVTTRSGKTVLLQIYSDVGTRDQTTWAMRALKRSMKWDEARFGLELDLDRFMIVAARDFNMGAMENKGLNIFNAAYVLADPQTATDANFQAIEAVIGHEYFHNWTGNRVTCRDWFQLSLKEGLTVFRDQEFTADMLALDASASLAKSARAVKRIDDVVLLRAAQFPEDAGPMAHPIRPESYQEISNFYTATVYEKGAEVIRMMHTLLGESTFQVGIGEYFRRHDGQAVTCDDFVDAMQWAWQQRCPDRDLTIFRRWYSQAGTPTVSITRRQDGDDMILTLSQRCDRVGVEKESALQKEPFHIPLSLGFLSAKGDPIAFTFAGSASPSALLELRNERAEFRIEGVATDAIPSLNRGFSAPVHVEFDYTDEQLAVLATHDTDAFARWEAMQLLFVRHLLQTTPSAQTAERIVAVCANLLQNPRLDAAYLTRLLTLPADKYLLQLMDPMQPLALAKHKQQLEQTIGAALADALLSRITAAPADESYAPTPAQSGMRALRNLALALICQARHPKGKALAVRHFATAANMTDRLGGLKALLLHPDRDDDVTDALTDFYERFQADPLVIDKWFTLQATAPGTSVDNIRGLIAHPSFDRRNPNRLRSLVFQFCLHNPFGFHVAGGAGYAFWSEQVILIDQSNPEIAARLARVLDHWAQHETQTRDRMREALITVANHPSLSGNTREIVSKALTL